jgi:dTDP-4-dehydrorhamnose reductase
MKALVIGASGLVGGALMRALPQHGIQALGTYNGRAINGATIRLDVTDADAVERCLRDARLTAVYFAVNPPGGVDYCEREPDNARAINVNGVAVAARTAADIGATFVYYSSDYIFDGAAGPYAEDDPPAPVNIYGHTKLDAERIVIEAGGPHLILRTTTVFGWDKASKNFGMQVSQRLGAGERMRVPNDQWSNPTLAEFLADASIRLCVSGTTGVVHVAGRDQMPRSEFAARLARTMSLDASLIDAISTAELGQPAKRPLRAGLRIGKLASLLGEQPPSIEQSLERFRRQRDADPPAIEASTKQS